MRSLAGLVSAIVLGWLALAVTGAVAEAQESDCSYVDPVTLECGVDITVPGGNSGPRPGDTPDGPSTPRPTTPALPVERLNAPCASGWEPVDPSTLTPEQLAAIGGMANPQRCAANGLFRPAPPDAPVAPTAEQVAGDLWLSVKDTLSAPTIAADPPVGTASIVTLPVFVEVTNWQGVQTEQLCDTGVCVTLTATPTLLFYSGEPDTRPVVCDPPGTRFDPDGAEPEVQAQAPGACAHVYTLRSGVSGRPDEWPAEVEIVWDVQWTSNVSGPGGSGTFDPMALATAVPREVGEVQTVVVEGSTD